MKQDHVGIIYQMCVPRKYRRQEHVSANPALLEDKSAGKYRIGREIGPAEGPTPQPALLGDEVIDHDEVKRLAA
jgi:hypothetical protein